jgi:hypothetical protein
VYCFESFNETKKAIPEFDNITSTTWWSLLLKIIFKGAFVGVFEKYVVVIPMAVATMKLYNAL